MPPGADAGAATAAYHCGRDRLLRSPRPGRVRRPPGWSSHLPHQLLDCLHLVGQQRQLGAQLLLVRHRVLGELAVGGHRDRVGAMALQLEVRPEDHGDHRTDDEDDPQRDRDGGEVRRVDGRQRDARHLSLSSLLLSSSSPVCSVPEFSASMIVSAVSSSSNGASSKYFMALPSSESSSCPVTSPAFSSLSRCMYSKGLDIPSLRASSLTCTRPPDSSAMTRIRCGFATAVSTASSRSSLVSVCS